MMKTLFHSEENIVGKGENAGCLHFFHFPTMFSKAFFIRVVKSQDCLVKGFKEHDSKLISSVITVNFH